VVKDFWCDMLRQVGRAFLKEPHFVREHVTVSKQPSPQTWPTQILKPYGRLAGRSCRPREVVAKEAGRKNNSSTVIRAHVNVVG
jgi:hypothetical protein